MKQFCRKDEAFLHIFRFSGAAEQTARGHTSPMLECSIGLGAKTPQFQLG